MPLFQRSALILLAMVLAACGSGPPTTAASTRSPENFATSAPSAEPSATATIAPTETPLATPEFTGGVEPGLTAQNMVGGKTYDASLNSWVTKNADGKVTAQWDGIKWIYHPENLKYVTNVLEPPLWTDPYTDVGLGIYPEDWSGIPSSWKEYVSPRLNDPLINELPLGFVDTQHLPGSGGSVANFDEFTVIFAGIQKIEKTDDPSRYLDPIYIVGVQYVDPAHPDVIQLLTIPITKKYSPYLDLIPGGQYDTAVGALFDRSKERGPSGQAVIDSLSDPNVIGRRMVIRIFTTSIAGVGAGTNYTNTDNLRLEQALKNGTSLMSLRNNLQNDNLRIPLDLDIQ